MAHFAVVKDKGGFFFFFFLSLLSRAASEGGLKKLSTLEQVYRAIPDQEN